MSTLLLGVRTASAGDGNLVNLYDWVEQPNYDLDSFTLIHSSSAQITSSNSAWFFDGLAINPDWPFNSPILYADTFSMLVANLETIPGASYEISCTFGPGYSVESDCGGSIMFGDVRIGGLFQPESFGPSGMPVDYYFNADFTSVATSGITAMSISAFAAGGDLGDSSIVLSNFSVIEVPETSEARILVLAATLLLAWRGRRFFPKSKGV